MTEDSIITTRQKKNQTISKFKADNGTFEKMIGAQIHFTPFPF
jgi:hypothetical protein